MNIIRFITLIALFSVTLLAAETAFDYFTAKSDGKDITIEWRPSIEKSVSRYEVQRSTDNKDFRTVAVVEARGTYNAYRYVDQDALLKGSTTDQKQIAKTSYYYRLRIVGTDNSESYSNVSSVVHSVSSVRRTWGMIKEMFK